jgi:hypothetical protein
MKLYLILVLPLLLHAEVQITVPDSSMEQGLNYELPLAISNVDQSDEIVSIELTINWNPSVLIVEDLSNYNALTENWSDPAYSISEGELTVWMYGEVPIIEDGIIISLNIRILDDAPVETTFLSISRSYLNEGSPQVTAVNAEISILPWDITSPATISDLSIDSVGSDFVHLSWTSPGDDDVSGTATEYDIRFAQVELSEANWENAQSVQAIPSPSVSGTLESIVIGDLYSTQHYFIGIKTIDDRNNSSDISNVVDTITVDNILPEVSINYPNTNSILHAGLLDSIKWYANDLSGIYVSNVFLTTDFGENYSLIDSVTGNETGDYTLDNWLVPNVLSTGCAIKVEVFDNNSLTNTTQTLGHFSIEDVTDPIVSVHNPSLGNSYHEYDTLEISWLAEDNIGIDSLIISFNRGEDDSWVIIDTNPTNDGVYDWAIPYGTITELGKIFIEAFDISGNSTISESEGFFSIIDNTQPAVQLLSPVEGITLGIGDEYEIMWLAEDNVGVTYVDIEYNTEGNWLPIAENLISETSYLWSVPNEPTVNLQLRLIGYDAVGLSDTSRVDGMAIEIAYPTVISIIPAPGRIDFSTNVIEIKFSQTLDVSTIALESIQTQSFHSLGGNPTFTYIDSAKTLNVSFENGLVSQDTLIFTLKRQLTNIYGYELDGNSDGIGGDDYSFEYHTSILADFNGDMAISVEDLSLFLINWQNEEYEHEIGPFLGEVPHVTLLPDQEYNIEDIVSFALAWNWYSANNTVAFTYYEDDGNLTTFEAGRDSIYFDVPLGLSAYQIQIKYPPGSLLIGDPILGLDMHLTNDDIDRGVYTVMVEGGSSKLVIPIEIIGARADISVSYKGLDTSGELFGQMTRNMTLEILPSEYVLTQNYPNPFNASTMIEYGLPVASELSICIYDARGRFVRELHSGPQQAGFHSIQWDGLNTSGQGVASGLYFVVLSTQEFRKVSKAVILK